ncbi:MAG: Flp pilus assembly complex ATPase component TadA [Caulobacterales bacterium]|nr:Flp pilus assembly complex ATPase component TadA [Caulobacterales bacterium]
MRRDSAPKITPVDCREAVINLSRAADSVPAFSTLRLSMRPSHDTMARLADLLCTEGAVSLQQLHRANRVAEESAERLDVVLCRLGMVGESDMADAMARTLGLERVAADALAAEAAILDALGSRFLTTAKILPIGGEDEPIRLVMADPLDASAADAVRLKLRREVTPCVAAPSEIEAALERHLAGEGSALGDIAAPIGAEADTAADIARLKDMAAEAPVIRIVNHIIRRAVDARASDIHIEPFEQSLRVRLRVDGVLREIDPPPGHLRAAVISRLKIMAALNIAEQRLPQDGRIQIVAAGRAIDMRVATTPTLHGEGVVLRLLDRAGLILDFDGLGFDAAAQAALEPLLARPNGVLLVTGPTGSGKTTTLYAAVSRINSPERKIVTIEDPVEYQLPGVPQIQVKSQIGLTFAHGLRSILRQDPDIIMVGEIRDRETAQIAVQAALTGHLVLATLHTNSAAAAINRLRDMGVEDYLITATLIGVVAQRLVRRLCPSCAGPEDRALSDRLAPGRLPDSFRAPVGCEDCRDTGYRGRTSVVEVLAVDEAVRRATLERRDQQDIEAIAVEGGMRTMRAHALETAARGETSLAEVMRVLAER